AAAANAGGGGIGRTSTGVATVTIQNSVVAGNTNTVGPDIVTGASGSTVNVTNSAIGSNTGFTYGTNTANIAAGTDLKLAPLANWGGTTKTVSLLPGSPLIDAGNNALIPVGITADQRGGAFTRTSGTVDIGAL